MVEAGSGAEASSTGMHGRVLSGTGGVWRVLRDADDVAPAALSTAPESAPVSAPSTANRERIEARTVEASMRGRLKREGGTSKPLKLAVGDRVDLQQEPGDDSWTMTRIHERHSQLARRSPTGGYGERVVVSNVDQVLVVFAAARPEPHPRMLDRFLVIAEANDLGVQIVVNKCDLLPAEQAMLPFRDHVQAGYTVHQTSTVTGAGLESLRAAVEGRISALSGPSGVGKSSLLNALYPGLDLRVGAISDSVNKGRHTTVGALLHPLPAGGFVADTPGLREVGMWGIDPREVAQCFPEFRELLHDCRFADCTHTVEPQCAIREAVDAGTVSRSRWESYTKLRGELADTAAQQGW